MEGKKQLGSSSSFSSELFGSKDSSSSPSSSSTGIFGSVFPPPSTRVGRDSRSDVFGSLTKHDSGSQACDTKNGTSGQRSEGKNQNISDRNRSSIFQDETVEPCFLSSSLYYGAQDVYSHSPNKQDVYSHSPNTRSSAPQPIFKKDGKEDDQNESNLDSASRGNWWQGSLYY